MKALLEEKSSKVPSSRQGTAAANQKAFGTQQQAQTGSKRVNSATTVAG